MGKIVKKTPIGTISAQHINEERFGQGFYIDLWGNEKKYPKHLQPLCRVEYMEATRSIRVSVFADGDENAPVSVTDITLNDSLIGVIDKEKGVLVDKEGNRYMCDCDGAGHIRNEQTGELLQAYCRNGLGVPTSIGPLKGCNE